jgi:glycogen synthase
VRTTVIRRPALLPSAFDPHKGGVEELTRQLALEQRRRGWEPFVVTHHWPKSLPRHESVDGIPVLRLPFRVPEPEPRQFAGWALYSAATERRLSSALRRRRVDLVHVQCVSNNARYALHASRALGVPLVVSMQGELGMDASHVYKRSRQARLAWFRLVSAAHFITACSQYVIDEAEAFFGAPFGDRAVVVANGVDVAACRATTAAKRERHYILGLGRLVHQKGYDLLVSAFASLCTDFPAHELIIAGEGPVLEDLRKLTEALGVSRRVEFLGGVDHDRALQLFAGADVFVLASRHEPQGIVVLEAMAAGALVVAAGVGGVPETVRDRENGLLFVADDSEDLARALREALSLPSGELKANAFSTAQHYDWRRQADLYEECYERAAERHGLSRSSGTGNVPKRHSTVLVAGARTDLGSPE